MPSPVDLARLVQALPGIDEGLKVLVDLGAALIVLAKLAKAVGRAGRAIWRRLRGRSSAALVPARYRRRCSWRALPTRRLTACKRSRR
jgi:hypothetical protein